MKQRVCAVAVIAASMVLSARPFGAADNWVEVTSPNFRVVSNNGERSAREVAWQFEEVRAAIAQGWPWASAPPDRPFLIIGLKDENTMKSFAPAYYEKGKSVRYSSISQSDWDRHYIGLRADLLVDGPEGVNPYQSAYWSYISTMLSSSFHSKLPMWFTRGLSEVLSNTNVTEKEVQIGRAIPSNVREFKSGARFPLEQLFTMTRQSPEMQRQIDLGRFDAEAWALMHFMLFGDADPARREGRINALASALASGTPSIEAVTKTFGPLAELDAAYRGYVDRGLFRFMTMRVNIQISPKDFSAAPASPGRVAEVRAGYLVASNRPVEARAAIDQARQLAPDSTGSYEVEGLMLERAQDKAGAEAAYRKAIDLQSANFLPYLRLSYMQRDPGPESAATRRALLEKSVALNNNYPQSQQALSAALLQAREFEAALVPARRAVALNPADVYGHVTLAQALAQSGKRDEAVREAQTASLLARTDAEKQSVQRLVEMIDRIK